MASGRTASAPVTVQSFDPANTGTSAQLTNSNFDVQTSGSGLNRWALTKTQKSTGKWRQQFLIAAQANSGGVGVATGLSLGTYAGSNASAACTFGNEAGQVALYYNGGFTNYPILYATNDRLDMLVDVDAGKAWWTKNGVVMAGDPVAGTGAMFTFTPGATVRLCADVTGAGGRIRLLQPAAFTGSPFAGFADGW